MKNDPYIVLGIGTKESEMYDEAVAAGDWIVADRIYLDKLKASNPDMYRKTLYMAGLAHEFNLALVRQISRSKTLFRWMDPEELQSYEHGTFESKMEEGGKRREYKAFSLGINVHSRRPMSIMVPIDDAIRGKLRAVTYTALPRLISRKDERIGDRKHLSYAHETECRLPDGTRVPRGSFMRMTFNMNEPAPDLDAVISRIDSLKAVGIEVDMDTVWVNRSSSD